MITHGIVRHDTGIVVSVSAFLATIPARPVLGPVEAREMFLA